MDGWNLGAINCTGGPGERLRGVRGRSGQAPGAVHRPRGGSGRTGGKTSSLMLYLHWFLEMLLVLCSIDILASGSMEEVRDYDVVVMDGGRLPLWSAGWEL